MSRQLDKEEEDRGSSRRLALEKALNSELAETLDLSGITLLGFAVKYDAWECLLTLKADVAGVRRVSFIGSDTVTNAVLKALSAAKYDRLRWKDDIYKPSQV